MVTVTVLRLFASAIVLALAGCSAAPAQVPASTASTAAPIFASDADALAAATAAYAAYLNESDQISADGGADPDRIAPFVTPEFLKSESAGFAEFRKAQARSIGSTSFRVFKMVSAEYENGDHAVVSAYICEDVSGIDVLDSQGVSLVTASRRPVTPFQVRFEMGDALLVVADRVVWEGSNFC